MKKRLGIILSLSVLVVLLTSSLSFAAGGLKLTGSSPEEGSKSSVINNVAIKLYFNENITSQNAQQANEDCFKITNPKGEEVSYQTLYNPAKYPDQIWIQLKKDLVQDTEYKVTISKDLQSSDGDKLAKDEVIHFRTRNTNQDNSVYMIMMVVMFGGMFVFSAWDMKRQKKKKVEEVETAINPYKLAKEKGISYEEALALAQKEKERLEKKRRKQEQEEQAMMALLDEDDDDEEGRYYVSRKRPISAAGGTGVPRSSSGKNRKREQESPKKQQEHKAKSQSKGQKKKNKK